MKRKSLTLVTISMLVGNASWIEGATDKKIEWTEVKNGLSIDFLGQGEDRQFPSYESGLRKVCNGTTSGFNGSPQVTPGTSQAGTPHGLFSPAASRRRTPDAPTPPEKNGFNAPQTSSTCEKAAATLAALELASKKFELEPDQTTNQLDSEETPQPSPTKSTGHNFELTTDAKKDSDITDNGTETAYKKSGLTKLLEARNAAVLLAAVLCGTLS